MKFITKKTKISLERETEKERMRERTNFSPKVKHIALRNKRNRSLLDFELSFMFTSS